MAIGFRVGVPGARVRVSSRGVRCSVGPRIARVTVGTGATRVPTGLGPFFASTALGGGRRTSYGPTPAQLAARERAARRTAAQEERLAAIRDLAGVLDELVSVHRGHWPSTLPPRVTAPRVEAAGARADAVALLTEGIGVLQRRERAAAKERAELAVQEYLQDETLRLDGIARRLQAEADSWWQALLANDEQVVVQALNSAFSDNPAGGVALGVDGAGVSVLLRQPDLATLPEQRPDMTPGGKPTMRKMAQRDRNQLFLRAMASNVAATLREGFAVAPGLQTMTVCVVSRGRTQQLAAVLLGRWSRAAVEGTAWGQSDDAWSLILDRAEELQLDLTSTGEARPLKDAGLQELYDLLVEHDDEEGQQGAPPPVPPLLVRAFGDWWRESAGRSAPASEPAPAVAPVAPSPGASPPAASPPSAPPSVPPPPGAALLSRGQALPLGADRDVTRPLDVEVAYGVHEPELDLSVLLLGPDGRVRGDGDLVFYNAPTSPYGAVVLANDPPWKGLVVARARIDVGVLAREGVSHVAIIVSRDRPLDASVLPPLVLAAGGPAYALPLPGETGLPAAVVAEIYLRGEVWRLRAPAQGWADGLRGLVRSFGVDAT